MGLVRPHSGSPWGSQILWMEWATVGKEKENEFFIEDSVVLSCVGLHTPSGTAAPECWSTWGARAQAHSGWTVTVS